MISHVSRRNRKLLKPSRLVFLIVLLVSNTFAWFIYATKIDNEVSVHVRAWNVIFEAGQSHVTDTLNLNVDNVYPGMEDYEYNVNAYNRSEVSASLSYPILRARILDDEYISVEEKDALGLTVDPDDMTSAEIRDMLLNDFPFVISISTSADTIQEGNGTATYTLSVTWPYENNHDDLDTQWGIAAHDYKESNPDSPSIALKVKIIITQNAPT